MWLIAYRCSKSNTRFTTVARVSGHVTVWFGHVPLGRALGSLKGSNGWPNVSNSTPTDRPSVTSADNKKYSHSQKLKIGNFTHITEREFPKIFDETFHPVQYERFWCSNSVDINAYIWIKKTWFFSEMFWRQILTRPVIPITSAVAITYFINDSQFKTVLAKDHEKIKVFGFRGSPDTHALLTYLNWAGISYEFENVNPFKLDNLENLPCSKY